MSSAASFSRRRFLQGAAASAVAVPYLIPAQALGLQGNVAPSNRIVLGLVGCGDHGTGWNLPQIFHNDDSQVIAVCDVDRNRCLGAKNTVQAFYSQKWGKDYKGCTAHDDFRDLKFWQDGAFETVVFDPPYKLNGTPAMG